MVFPSCKIGTGPPSSDISILTVQLSDGKVGRVFDFLRAEKNFRTSCCLACMYWSGSRGVSALWHGSEHIDGALRA